MPVFLPNQSSIFAHVIRVISESSNNIVCTNGLKIIKLLIENRSPLLPRQFSLLPMFDKYKLMEKHQNNNLIYEICDSILMSGCSQTSELLLAIYEGGNSRKKNVKTGSIIVFFRVVSILTRNEDFFAAIFDDVDKLAYVLASITPA